MKKQRSIAARLTLTFTAIVVLSCALLVTTSLTIFTRVNTVVEEIRYNDVLNENVKSEVQSGISIVQSYYDREQAGELTEEEAQNLAKDAIRAIRYNDDQGGYIWIDNTDGDLVMHPILPEQEGDNRLNLEDCNGVMIIQEILKTAENGGGFNHFVFTKADGVTEAEKVAYSEEFGAWGWILTSGCYLDDIQAHMDTTQIDSLFDQSAVAMILESLVLIIIMILLTIYIVRKLMKSLGLISNSLDQLSQGNLTFTFEDKMMQRTDEIGTMVHHTSNAIRNLRKIVEEGMHISDDVDSASNEMMEAAHTVADTTDQISQAIESVAMEATEQADSISDVMQNINSMQEGTTQIQDSVNDIGSCARQLQESSNGMRHDLQEMQKGSSDMTEQVHNIAEKIDSTNKTIGRMSDILNSIEEIADQTKLLSLNASIEAARAGESGRGFAVVAESIKGLSENTSSELSNIKEIIDNLVKNFAECTECIDKVVESNAASISDSNEVIQAFHKLDEQIAITGNKADTIHTVIQGSITAINAISDQITDIAHGAESAAAASEEVTASVEELRALMQTMDSHTEKLHEKADNLNQTLNTFSIS